MICEIDLLNDEQLEYITKYFKYLQFEDGKRSNTAVEKVCQTVFDGSGNYDLNMYCREIISDKISFVSKISQVYFVKYGVGGKYDDHYDANPCGGVKSDYSMTCFLSDNYEGGELVITNNNEETPIKLQKGRAIIYPGDLLHRVNEVKSGRRDVFIAWMEK